VLVGTPSQLLVIETFEHARDLPLSARCRVFILNIRQRSIGQARESKRPPLMSLPRKYTGAVSPSASVRFLQRDAACTWRGSYSAASVAHSRASGGRKGTAMLVPVGLRPLWPVILFVPWFFLGLALLLWPARKAPMSAERGRASTGQRS
jgi:hypothetical protein